MQKIILICLKLLLINTLWAQEIIPFEGRDVLIDGWAKNLAIVGSTESKIKINEASPDKDKCYSIEMQGESVIISLKPNCQNVAITIPKSANLRLTMVAVVRETMFDRYKGSDWRAIAISKVDGNIESESDGYHIALDRVNGSVSVVTYGNISAKLPDLSNSELISLDTYWGNVYAKIPSDISASLSLTAKSGKVDLSRDFKLEKKEKNTRKKLRANLKDGKLPIILHSEDGDVVTLESFKR